MHDGVGLQGAANAWLVEHPRHGRMMALLWHHKDGRQMASWVDPITRRPVHGTCGPKGCEIVAIYPIPTGVAATLPAAPAPVAFDPRRFEGERTFFLVFAASNADGTVNLGGEEAAGCADLDSAVETAFEAASRHGSNMYIYECRPVRRVRRPAAVMDQIVTAARVDAA